MRAHGASAKEIHCTALAHQFDRLLPRLRHADRLNCDIHAAVLRRESACFANGGADRCRLHHMRRAQLARRLCLAVVLHNGDGLAAGQRGHVQNHQPQGSAANHGHRIAGARARVLEAMHRTGQRLGQRRVLQRDVIRYMERILCRDARRNADELGVSAVIEEQIVAEILLRASAKITEAARG